MTATSTLRSWWDDYECQPKKMVRVALPRANNGTEKVLVAEASAPVWAAVAQIMDSEPYYFVESAGGTYNCRPIGDSGKMSLHAFGIALDLNPKKNPHRSPLTTDMPDTFIKRMEGIRANGKQALKWGGRWSKPDAMHYQIDVAPADCAKSITWDDGMEIDQMGWKSADGYTYTDDETWGQFSDAIKWNINEGLMKGRRNEADKTAIFDPNTPLQRDEAASVFYRIGKDSPTFKREIED